MGRKKKIDKLTDAQLEEELTPKEVGFLEKVRAGRKDPVYFAEVLLGIALHPKQKIWLWLTTKTKWEECYKLGLCLALGPDGKLIALWNNAEEFERYRHYEYGKNILVPSNRWGKTLVTSVKHLWYNYYKIGVRGNPDHIQEERCGTLNLSPHSNQCDAGYQYIADILNSQLMWNSPEVINGVETGRSISHKNECLIGDHDDNPMGPFLAGSNQQKRQHNFSNGTFYKAVPTGEDQASSLAGNPYLYISYDECAQSLHLKNELPAKIMSRLIDYGGPLDLLSTPEVDKPSHAYFHHIAKQGLKGEDGWFTMIGQQDDNTFLSEKEKNKVLEQIKMIDPAKYRQVKYGEFVTTGKKMFDNLVVERLWDAQQTSLPMHEHLYSLSGDWGFSDTGDPTVFYVIDYTEVWDWFRDQKNAKWAVSPPKYRIVFREGIRGGSPFAVMARAKMLQREWNGARFVHDASSMGGVLIKKMLKEMEMHDVIDFDASGGNKMDMLFTLQLVLSEGRRVIIDVESKVTDQNPNFGKLRSYYIPELEEQLGNYQYNPDKGVTDKKLEQDDVMSLGMNLWFLEKKLFKNTVKNIGFNPLAPTVETIFPTQSAQAIRVRQIMIPEKVIM